MGRRGRDRQQPDENCGLANETIVPQTKSRVTPNLSVSSLSVKSACFSQAQFSTRSPESATKNSLRMSLESQSGPAKSMKSLLPTQIFLQKRCFAPETRLGSQIVPSHNGFPNRRSANMLCASNLNTIGRYSQNCLQEIAISTPVGRRSQAWQSCCNLGAIRVQ